MCSKIKSKSPFTQLSAWILVVSLACSGCRHHSETPVNHRYAALETDVLLAGWKQTLEDTELSADEKDRLNLHVRAIFAHRCFGCHSTSKHKGALVLDAKSGVFEGGDNGPIIVPGDAGASEIMRRVRLPESHDDVMPPEDGKLTDAEIETLALWINQGATWTDRQLKIFREAPLALAKPPLPDQDDDHPIDQWVSKYFDENDIDWPQLIDDRGFIRRVHLDVVGLLPSDDVVEAFISNRDPNKRTKLIDTLLMDRQNYAVHWMTFWNDLLRNDYSGTGFITNGRKQISGWLFEALTENMPYDAMVSQLLNPTEASEGFIQGIQWRGEVNASQRIELQAAQNISQTLLGLNLKCASCHNSFVNNVTLQQAYDFAQVFADSTLELYRCDKPTGKSAKPSFIFPELGLIEGDSLSDRLASLVDVLVQPDNGRLYRTVVNRYWAKFFGRGLVAPVDEMDNRPWSEALLDWLAADFRENGSDLTLLIRQIVTSKTYQLEPASYPNPLYLKSSQFVFEGPMARKMTAEQFADAVSSICTPMYHSLAFDPHGRDMTAKWIWMRQEEFDRTVLPYPGVRYFRHGFSIPQPAALSAAHILIAVDHEYDLYVNQQQLGSGVDWHEVDRYDVLEVLEKQNIIAIKAVNDGEIPNHAGILFALKLDYTDGRSDTIFSDDSWLVTDSLTSEKWTHYSYDDGDWEDAWKAGNYAKSHWGRLLNFTFDEADNDRLARAGLVKLDPFLKGLGRPSRENVLTQRDDAPTLLQALLLSNDQFFARVIAEGAEEWVSDYGTDRELLIDQLYQTALGRLPTEKEKMQLIDVMSTQPSVEEVSDVIWSVLLLPEFLFI
ncbi:MAG: DUF1549 domain-containing protein [Saprospiraceae bacterium]|nr:DUF1549 domain-containing protein [Saprospiraceae bacterium]